MNWRLMWGGVGGEVKVLIQIAVIFASLGIFGSY